MPGRISSLPGDKMPPFAVGCGTVVGQGVLVQRLCEGALNRSDDAAVAKDGFEKVSRPAWNRLNGLLHAVGGMSG